MSDAEIVRQCNKLARIYYELFGYVVGDDFKFYDSRHPQELSMWNLAVIAYDHIAETDVMEALSNLEE